MTRKTNRDEFERAHDEWRSAAAAVRTSRAAVNTAHERWHSAKGADARRSAWDVLWKARVEEHLATDRYARAAKRLTEAAFKVGRENPCGGEFVPRSKAVHWSKDPAKRKRQLQHIRDSILARKNPFPLLGALGALGAVKPNPAPILPAEMALLGEACELHMKDGRRFKWPNNRAALLASADARTIAIVRPTRATLGKGRPPSGAAKMYEKWSQFRAHNAARLELPDVDDLGVDLGACNLIRYRSDKWTGKPQLYEHRFTGNTAAHAESSRAPRVILVTGKPSRVIVNERGIVG